MDVNRIFSAEQIAVPPELPLILKDWTKAVIRNHPEDLLEFSLQHFQEKFAQVNQHKQVELQLQKLKQLFSQYDVDGNGRMESKELKRLLLEDFQVENLSEQQVDEAVADLDPEATGFIEQSDLVQWFAKRY